MEMDLLLLRLRCILCIVQIRDVVCDIFNIFNIFNSSRCTDCIGIEFFCGWKINLRICLTVSTPELLIS